MIAAIIFYRTFPSAGAGPAVHAFQATGLGRSRGAWRAPEKVSPLKPQSRIEASRDYTYRPIAIGAMVTTSSTTVTWVTRMARLIWHHRQ
jgi:hypothetical protein